ncbi:TonB-dependent receptor [Pseudohaliea rubra]|uniref:Oar-like outer membrane protein, OmpA family n=1 Tax=Pseudohaliea rubra DSM 19751 TaxID=1265313 RepID=A0A095VTA7_9GAMM|nr:TonB-dependent receptor [Pseudohaliea rubra]KGE04682.1 Oar-like outer membrane protein, OmpA family [Pseudohaliea rubra DSM 19751]
MPSSFSKHFARKALVRAIAGASVVGSFGLTAPVYAQETTAAVRGVVSSGGQPVAGATVTATNRATGLSRSATTDENGNYFIRQLPAGVDYSVSVTSPQGGASTERLKLAVGQQAQMNYAVNAIEEVVVMGSAAAVADTAIGPTAVFDISDLQNSPAINRNINDIIGQDPRVYIDQSSRADSIQCNGANPRFNSLTVDGIRLNDGFGLNSNGYPTQRMPFPFDAISSVAVEMAPMSVIYGGFSACNINAVTKSGGNELSGSVFMDYTDDSMQGDKLEGDSVQITDYDETRYGFELGGAIIEDKLFFYGAYEKYEGVDFNDRGAIGSGAVNEVLVTQAELDEIARIARDVYQFEPGSSTPGTIDFEDEKYIGKLDWYITDTQRLALSYMYNESVNATPSDGENVEFEFSDHFYNRGAELNSYIASLYSDWTDNFSTEIRIARTEVDFVQSPRAGNDFGEMRVELEDVDVYLGGDDSRHANALEYTIDQIVARGRYQLGSHTITGGYERESYDIFNLFYQHVDTEIRFDGIDNFRDGLADRVYYGNAISNNENDIAEAFEYAINYFYLQDEWQVNDKLTVTYGLRYDYYETDDAPNLNQGFQASYGFGNNETLDGRDLLQPRFGFNYDFSEDLSFRGGVGLFSGGNPNVWLSNTYSNTNTTAVQARIDGMDLFAQNYVNCEDGVPVCGPGYGVPQEIAEVVAAGDGSNFEINFLDPDFDIPSEWKYTAGLTWFAPMDITVTADLQISRGEDTAIYKRADLERVGTNDLGYPVYESVRDPAFVLTNASNGNESESIAFSAFKAWDNGFDLRVGYAYTEAEDVNPMTSSVAFSNYINRAFVDPQAEELGPSNWAIEHRFTTVLNYSADFFGGYETRVSLFGQYNSGIPYSITLGGAEGTIDAFGFQPFLDFERNVLPIGGSRNSQEGDSFSKIDLRISQEVPGFAPGHRGSAFIIVDNLTNLLNDDWGVMNQPAFPYGVTAEQEANGQAQQRIGDTSLWSMRVGLSYRF